LRSAAVEPAAMMLGARLAMVVCRFSMCPVRVHMEWLDN